MNYKLVALLEKIKNIFLKVILFIPSCICCIFDKLNQKYKRWRKKEGYSKNKIDKVIKYCDDYYINKNEDRLFLLNRYNDTEYEYIISYHDFIKVYPFWVRGKFERIYYSNMDKFESEIYEYYKDKILTRNEIVNLFTRSDGTQCYWGYGLKDRKLVSFKKNK